MKLQRIGFTALFTLLTTLSFGNFPVISNSQSKTLKGVALAQTPEARKAEADRFLQQGRQQFKTSQFEAALKSWQQALILYREIKDRQGEGEALGKLGVIYYFLGDYSRAIDYAEKQLAIAKEIKDREGEGGALGSLGLVYHDLGDYSRAINYWEKSLAIAREIKDRQGEGRARAFIELLAQKLSSDSQKTSSETNSKPTISQIRQIAKAENATLVQYSIIGDYFQVQGKQKPKESELYIWVVKPTGEVIFRKSDLKPLWQQKDTTLANLVINSRESIGARGIANAVIASQPTANQTERLQQLHQILIEPIADLLPSDPNSRVIFVPQSSLFLVPFSALQDKSGKYLIEKHTILTAPSIQVLELTRQQKQKSRTTGKIIC